MKSLFLSHRYFLAYITFFIVGMLLFYVMIIQDKSPDQKIVGKWREVSWQYEKVNRKKATSQVPKKQISDEVKQELAKSLIIYKAKTWEFLPDGRLLLHQEDGRSSELKWNLKGRGHILELRTEDQTMEYYDLSDISRKEMVLYFDVEIQAKGIVRMKFEKIS